MAMTLPAVIGLAAAAYLGLALVLALWADRRPTADECLEVRTEDNWCLTVHRFLPQTQGHRHTTPVILAHGLMMNRASWELSPEGSMIRELCRRGHDVFVAEYRGTRSSQGPAKRGETAFWNYSVEDHAYRDLPAIIDGVCKLTGRQQVNWVGHSMGGIVLYLYAARFGCDRLRRVVTLGTPVVFSALTGPAPTAGRLYRRLLPRRKVFRTRAGLVAVLPLALLLPGPVLRLALNARNLGARARLTLIRGAAEDISTVLLDWFLNRAPTGAPASIVSAEGSHGNVLASFTAPLLVVAGSKDLLAPPEAVRPAFENAATEDKRYLLLDGSQPGIPSFGHSDMASSPASVEHLAPLVAKWLEKPNVERSIGDASAAS